MTLATEWQRERLQRLARARVADERRDREIRPIPATVERESLRRRSHRQRTREIADHEVVLQTLAAILPGAHIGPESVLVEREPCLRVRRFGFARYVHVGAIVRGRRLHAEPGFCRRRPLRELLREIVAEG